jgi:hypothetical protein
MSGGDGMDFTLECILTDTCRLLLLHPFVHAPKFVAFRGLEQVMPIRCGEPPGTFDRELGSLPRVIKKGRWGRQVLKSHLPMLTIGLRSDGIDCSRD